MLTSIMLAALVSAASDKDLGKNKQSETTESTQGVCDAKTSGKEKDVDLYNCREAPKPSPTPQPPTKPKHKH